MSVGRVASRQDGDAKTAALPLIAGRYRVERALGRGAAGDVLSVFDTSEGRSVALKHLTAGAGLGHNRLRRC